MNKQTKTEEDGWPCPGEDEMAITRKLRDRLIEEIDLNSGQIPFDHFMQIALYEPGLGYYCSGTKKFGAEGDFVTAPEISGLFSKTLAHQCVQILNTLEEGCILELGAGTGLMAKDILLTLEQSGTLPEYYYILEPSPELRQRQKETINKYAEHLVEHVIWLENEPETKFVGVVLANEIADALPFKRLSTEKGTLAELMVACEGDDLVWQKSKIQYIPEYISNKLSKLSLPDGYLTEAHNFIPGWLETLSNWLETGVILISDYGETDHDFYHADKREGSLRCYYRHRVHSDPFFNIGLQDITCNINFSELAYFAKKSGLDLLGYTSQANFLLGCGIEEIFAQSQTGNSPEENQKEFFNMVQQLKTLTMPEEMGERFKFIGLARNYDHPLKGFSFKDMSDRL